MQECLVLGARRYDFKDDSGRRVEGCTLIYLTGDEERSENRKGAFPLTIQAAPEFWYQLSEVPGYYAIDFRQRPGPGGKPQLQATHVKYLAPADLAHDGDLILPPLGAE